jgi:hypothetical protein
MRAAIFHEPRRIEAGERPGVGHPMIVLDMPSRSREAGDADRVVRSG